MHRAIERGDSATVTKLLEVDPALINEQLTFDSTDTPLILAIRCRKRAMVEMLLEKGADINKPNQRGITPLMAACIRSCDDVIALLLTIPETEVSLRCSEGLSALDYAVLYGHFPIAKLLKSIDSNGLKPASFYSTLAKKHSIRYVNYDVLLLHLEK